jgi:hypothetical protein
VLTYWEKIVRKQFTDLPMPESVIKRVDAIAARDKRSGNIKFSARDGTEIGDDHHDDDNEDITTVVDNGKDDDTGEEYSQNNPTGIPLENETGPSSDEINDDEAELIPTPDFTADIPDTDEGEIPGVGEDETPGVGEDEIPGVWEDEIPGVGEGNEESPPASTPMTLTMAMTVSQVLRPVMIWTAVTTRMMMTSPDHKSITHTPGHRPIS